MTEYKKASSSNSPNCTTGMNACHPGHQIFSCLKCGEDRVYGNTKDGSEPERFEYLLECPSCGKLTMHRFERIIKPTRKTPVPKVQP